MAGPLPHVGRWERDASAGDRRSAAVYRRARPGRGRGTASAAGCRTAAAVAHTPAHVRPAVLEPVAALVALALVLAVVLLMAPGRAAAPASTSPPVAPAVVDGGPVAA